MDQARAFLDQVKCMYDEGLYSNVRLTASLVLSYLEHSYPDKFDVNLITIKCQLLVYYGDSLCEDEQFRRVIQYYCKCLQLTKQINKNKSKTAQSVANYISEPELKYKVHQCHLHLKEFREASTVLESIPQRQRTPRINMALAKLYQRTGMERSAVSCYKEVVRSCPLALDAVLGLLSLNVTGSEVSALIMANLPSASNTEWISTWIKGHAFAYSGKHTKGAQVLKSLEIQHLRDNVETLCTLGDYHWQSGDITSSKAVFQRARSLDPYLMQGMDIYSQVLAQDGNNKELEKLSKELIQTTQQKPEPWIALAHYWSKSNKPPTRAVYFAQKAHTIDTRNVQALVLKASLLQCLEKHQEGLVHFREAVRLAPTNFDAQKGLVECYISAERYKEALGVAKNVHKTLGSNGRTLTLYALVLSQEPQHNDKAKTMLEKALSQDPSYTEAVCLLAEILGKEQEYSKAIILIKKHLNIHRTAKLHQLLGDYLALTNEPQEALEQYSLALSMHPGFSKAIEGIQNVEKRNNSTADLESAEGDELDNTNQGDSADEEDIEDVESWPGHDLVQGAWFQ